MDVPAICGGQFRIIGEPLVIGKSIYQKTSNGSWVEFRFGQPYGAGGLRLSYSGHFDATSWHPAIAGHGQVLIKIRGNFHLNPPRGPAPNEIEWYGPNPGIDLSRSAWIRLFYTNWVQPHNQIFYQDVYALPCAETPPPATPSPTPTPSIPVTATPGTPTRPPTTPTMTATPVTPTMTRPVGTPSSTPRTPTPTPITPTPVVTATPSPTPTPEPTPEAARCVAWPAIWTNLVPQESVRQDPYGSVKITSWGNTTLQDTSLWIFFHSGDPNMPRRDVWLTTFESDVPHQIEDGQLYAVLGEVGGTFEAAFTFDMDRNAQIGDLYVRAVVRSTSCGGVEHYAEDVMTILPSPMEHVQHKPLVIYSLTYAEDPFNQRWTANTNRGLEEAWERFDWYYGSQPVGHTIDNTLRAAKNAGGNPFPDPTKMTVRGIEVKRGVFTGVVLSTFVGPNQSPQFAP